MSFITFACYSCNQMLKVGIANAGKKTKCMKCGTLLTIPAAPAMPPPVPPAPVPGRPTPVAPLEEEDASLEELQTAELEELDDQPPPPRHRRRAEDRDDEDEEPRRRRRRDEEDEFEDEEDRRRRPRRYDDEDFEEDERRSIKYVAWPKARVGVLLVFIGTCILAGEFALEMLGYLLMSITTVQFLSGSLPTGSLNFRVFFQIASILEVGASIVCIVGYVFCLLGPNKRGTLGLAIATLVVAVLHVLLVGVVKIPAFFSLERNSGLGGWGVGVWVVMVIIHLLFSSQLILFLLYLRAALLSLKRKGQAGTCLSVLYLAGAHAGTRLLGDILSYTGLRISSLTMLRVLGWTNLALLWIGLFLFLGFIIWYLLVLWRARSQLR